MLEKWLPKGTNNVAVAVGGGMKVNRCDRRVERTQSMPHVQASMIVWQTIQEFPSRTELAPLHTINSRTINELF